MKRFLIAGIGSVFFGVLNTQKVNAALFTHILNYTTNDTSALEKNSTLEGRITFNSGHALSQTDLGAGNDTNFSDFITSITFTYNNDNLGSAITLTESNIEAVRITHSGTTEYDGTLGTSLYDQLTQLNFASDFSGSFTLNRVGLFLQNVNADDDFTLSSTTYHSPGPLPIFGLLTAFSAMKKLKSKYKNQTKFIINEIES